MLTTLDPDTAAKGNDPIGALVQRRRWDGRTWFRVVLVPDTQGSTVGVGDEAEVLSAVGPGEEPSR